MYLDTIAIFGQVNDPTKSKIGGKESYALIRMACAIRRRPAASVWAFRNITDVGVEWGKITALGALIALPPQISTFLAAKQIITGLTAGAVKG